VVACGGTFKIAEELARSLRWRQRFEWVYRLWQEPKPGNATASVCRPSGCGPGGAQRRKTAGNVKGAAGPQVLSSGKGVQSAGRWLISSIFFCGRVANFYFNYHYDIDGAAMGSATQVRDLAAALTRLGHRVDLQFRTAKPQGEPSREYLGLKQIRWLRRFGHIPRLIHRNLPLMREERRLLDNFKPDVVLAVSSYCNVSALAAARSRAVPFVLFAEAPLEYEYSSLPLYHRYRWWAAGWKGSICRAQQVVCISEVLKGYLMCYGVPA
jgi:hypothetical protein